MESVDVWTGRHACALQAALRMTNEAFAETLGIASRTVASWHSKPDIVPKHEFQQILDTALQQLPEETRARFGRLFHQLSSGSDEPIDEAAQLMRVAIAVVVDGDNVLLACRRGDDAGGISWQFPAGIVKLGASAATTAEREVLGETGIRCAARQELGSRLHPVTKAQCEYFLCDYLGGTLTNVDVVENADVAWVPRGDVTRYIARDLIYPPVMAILEEQYDQASS